MALNHTQCLRLIANCDCLTGAGLSHGPAKCRLCCVRRRHTVVPWSRFHALQMCEGAAPAEGLVNWLSATPNCRLSDCVWRLAAVILPERPWQKEMKFHERTRCQMLPQCEIRSSVSHASHGGIALYCVWLIKTLSWRPATTKTAISPPHLLTPAFKTAQNGDLRPIMSNAQLIRRRLLFDFCRS